MEVHQLGIVEWSRCVDLQRRVAYDAANRVDGKITVLLAEHPDVITVGKTGSRGDIRASQELLDRQNVAVHWVNRDGGTIYHAPGQLAIYPVVSLEDKDWTVREYMQRLLSALNSTLTSLGVNTRTVMMCDNAFSIWGRKGPLVIAGVHIFDGVIQHGAFLNVSPAYPTLKRIRGVPILKDDNENQYAHNEKQCMTSLVAELGRPAKMNRVRSFLLPALAKAMDHHEFHPTFGHPWLDASEQRRARLYIS